jgi:hypothetical protein
MRSDGVFILTDKDGFRVWNTNTQNNPGAYLVLKDDGNLVIYRSDKKELWSSWTNGKKKCP